MGMLNSIYQRLAQMKLNKLTLSHSSELSSPELNHLKHLSIVYMTIPADKKTTFMQHLKSFLNYLPLFLMYRYNTFSWH